MASYSGVRQTIPYPHKPTKQEILVQLSRMVDGGKTSVTEDNLAKVNMILTDRPTPGTDLTRYVAVIDFAVYVIWTVGNTLVIDRYVQEIVKD